MSESEPKSSRCEDCIYWDSSSQLRDAQPDTTGMCRIHAPRIDKRTGAGVWPFTHDTDWCGSFTDPPRTR